MMDKGRVSVQLFLCLVLSWGCMMSAYAQPGPNSDYLYFSNLADVSEVQIRLSYVGSLRDEDTPPVIFTTSGKSPDAAKFLPFERTSILYPASDVGVRSKDISLSQMQQLIINAGTVAAVSDDAVEEPSWLAFSMCDNAGAEPKVSEAILDKTSAATLLQSIASAVEADGNAFALVSELACSIGGLVAERPVDVSDNVTVQRTGVRLDRASNAYVSMATLTNTSAGAIEGPMSLVFNFAQGGVSLINPTGVTCGTSPTGLSYVDADLTNNVLLPGGSVEVMLSFASPNDIAVAATTKVLSGSGAR